MKKDYRYLEWNQQDRRRVIEGKKQPHFTACNGPEYQKFMRRMRRAGYPRDLIHRAAVNAHLKTPLRYLLGGGAS
jgi:hypothetical protein